MRKNLFFLQEISDSYRNEQEMQYQNLFWMKVFQVAEIPAEKVKCGCINAIRDGKCH